MVAAHCQRERYDAIVRLCLTTTNQWIKFVKCVLSLLEDYEDECEIHFSTPEEFANALKGRMKYIFVNQNGSYTIGYDDGYVFGGHEIDVDVDSKGKMVCADMR